MTVGPSMAVLDMAEAFWADAGSASASTFPRDIRRAVARAHPIAIVLLSALHVARAEAWLRRQGKAINIGVDDRPLRACLVARSGAGIIFVDGADSESEQRFSIAHELAHFLHDYLAPRHAAVARHGDEILEVLDGVRSARIDERAVALLSGVTARPHVHLMGRHEDFSKVGDIEHSESIADALALELLAPWELVRQQTAELGIDQDRGAIARALADQYGLPVSAATRYAALLCPNTGPSSLLLRHLRRVEQPTSVRKSS